MQNLIHGLGNLGNIPALAYLFAGAIIGVVIGVIPGLSTVIILSIILVFVYHIDLTGTLCLFIGANVGSFYSASISAILLNTPAHPEAFPITFDGYPMARKGQPARALGLSACSTLVGGLIGCGVLIGFLQIIDEFPHIFHPPEFVALVALAMLLVGTLGADSVLKAVVSAGAGLLIAAIGPDPITGTFRYTFGAVNLYGGISLVAVALGVFAIPQLVMVFGTGTASARQDMNGQELGDAEAAEITRGYGRQLTGGVLETFRYWGILLQGGIIGAVTGIIPGIGGFTGNLMSYGIAKQTARKSRRELYGTGIPEGIIAPEGSSIAKEAGHMIPLLGLGIPGGIAGALFIGALAIQNVNVGYGFQSAYPNVTGEIVWIMAISGLIGTVVGVLLGPQLAKITRVPGPLIVPFIFAVSVAGPFLTDIQFFSVMELLVFAVIGLILRRLRYPLGALVLGLVLGPTFETNVYQMHAIYPGVSWIGKRPLADAIFLVAIAVLVLKFLELHRAARIRRDRIAEELASIEDPLQQVELRREQQRQLAPYPLLAVITSALLLVVALFFIVYGLTNYEFTVVLMPVIGGFAVAVPAAFFLPRDVYRYLLSRRASAEVRREAVVETGGGAEPEMAAAIVDRGPEAADRSPEGGLASVSASTGIVEAAELLSDVIATSPTFAADIRIRSWGRNGQYRRELIAFGWLLGLVALCWLIGFPAASAIFMAAYGLTCTGRYLRTLRSRLIFTVISTAAVWLMIYEMFHLTGLVYSPHLSL